MNNFSINHKKDSDTVLQKDIFYTVNGLEDKLDEDGNCVVMEESDKRTLAKKIVRTDGTLRYSVKLNAQSKLYNPFSIYGNEKEETSNFLDRVCRNNNKFKEVNQKSFDLYVKFLKTKNNSLLYNAEREVE
tara:strand:- start:174 stop:566 length:393 start_codon:yes stop_codon:yes gene_type:complete